MAAATFGSHTVVAGNDEQPTRVFAGGRNAPSLILVAPAKQNELASQKTSATRTEVLAGGRNAPHQVRPASQTIEIAPAVRR
jgi:hypothetical protein